MREIYTLEATPYECVDGDGWTGSFAAMDTYKVFSRRMRSSKRAIRKSVRIMKRASNIFDGAETEFSLFCGTGENRRQIALPEVYMSSWSPGPFGAKYSVGYR